MMTDPTHRDDYREILTLLRSLEDRLTNVINTGLAAVNLAIATLTDAHHKALLEQERRNATFADRSHIERLERQLSLTTGECNGAMRRLAELESEVEELHERMEERSAGESDRSFRIVGTAAQLLVSILIVLMSVLLTYILTRGR